MNLTKSARTTLLLFFGLGLAVNGHSQLFLTNGLVAYYPLDGNTYDASGNGMSLTNNGATLTTDRFNNPNSAFSFDGVSSIMVETNTTDPLVLHDSFTLSCWAKIPSYTSTTRHSLVRKDGDVNMA